MMLRWLVANFIRQTARKTFRDVATKVARKELGVGEASQETAQLPPCEIAIVFALALESDGFVNLLDSRVTTRCASYLEHAGRLNERSIVVAESGIGARPAAKATEDLIAVHKPQWIVSAGFAGALADGFRRGDILMAERLMDLRNNKLSVGFKMDRETIEATRSLHVGGLLSVDGLIRTPNERRKLAERHDAVACDTETMAVATACRREKVRFLSVRVITDAVDDRLPVEVERLVDQRSIAGKLGAATGAVFKRPACVKDMWHLREDALKASDRLANFLAGVVRQLTVSTTDL
jgi:adenosylhomocysteine nucleosidase